MKSICLIPCLSVVLISTALTSCKVLETKKAPDSGFNPQTTATKNERTAFLQEAWISPAYQGTSVSQKFKSVYFAPVNTQYMAKQSWWQAQTPLRQNDLAQDTQKIATLLRHEFITAVAKHPAHKMKLALTPGPDTLVIEMALVELVPSKAFWNAASTAAGFAVPGAGYLSMAGRGSIAIEGRARNGADNSIIATFKDRRTDKVAPVNLSKYTWYHGAEQNIGEWAAEFASFLNTTPNETIKRTSRVTLKPW
jgi:hypothetical protein